MNTLLIQAVYENGVLKPDRPLPLNEHESVGISIEIPDSVDATIEAALDRVRASAGMVGWTGDAETAERLAMDPEFGVEESP